MGGRGKSCSNGCGLTFKDQMSLGIIAVFEGYHGIQPLPYPVLFPHILFLFSRPG